MCVFFFSPNFLTIIESKLDKIQITPLTLKEILFVFF